MAETPIEWTDSTWNPVAGCAIITAGCTHYPVPGAILGRLAVDRACQGQGLGETLLLDAIRRVVRASATLMVYAVIVDAKNDRAAAFYEHYGFRVFASEQRRLFLPLETFEKLGL